MKYVVIEKKRPVLGILPEDTPNKLIEIMKKCWHPDYNKRPSFGQILQSLDQVKIWKKITLDDSNEEEEEEEEEDEEEEDDEE